MNCANWPLTNRRSTLNDQPLASSRTTRPLPLLAAEPSARHSQPLLMMEPSGQGRRHAPKQQTVFGPLVEQSALLAQVKQGSSAMNSQMPSAPQRPTWQGAMIAHSSSCSHDLEQHSPRQHSKPGRHSTIASTQKPSTHVFETQGSSCFLLRQSRCVWQGRRHMPSIQDCPSAQPSGQSWPWASWGKADAVTAMERTVRSTPRRD